MTEPEDSITAVPEGETASPVAAPTLSQSRLRAAASYPANPVV